METRGARPEDYDPIIGVVDSWWGRPVSQALPRLFFDHFWRSSRVVEDEGGIAGFLVAFVSPSERDLAYVHFVGVRPDCRRSGVARRLYEEFSGYARARGCRELRAITAPGNTGSIRFHERLSFAVSEPLPGYNGPGREMVIFRRELGGDTPRPPPRTGDPP